MVDRPEAAIQAILAGIQNMQQLNMQLADRLALVGPGGPGQAVERDNLGRTRSEARKDYLGFTRDRPTFERGRDRWNDFAIRFQGSMRDHGVTEEQAKWVLYNAIVGQSSRLVIASMNPELMAIQHMEFREYLRRMGEKFTPAAESIQMEAEYRSRKQGKNEDVQNYINAKYELFQLAFPNAQERDRVEFYRETTEGFLNKYVRDQMFCFDANCVEAFGARAVNVVQIERRRIRIGDSDTNKMDGLIPVTRPIREDKPRTRFEAMEVDVMGPPPGEESDSDRECECAALYAGGRRGPCYYCTKEGHLLRSCPRKAAGLPRSAPFIEDKGGRKDDAKWKDQPPNRQEWGKGRYQEEWGQPLPPKWNWRGP